MAIKIIEGWVIMQAVAKKTVGFKGDGRDPRWFGVYAQKDECRDALVRLIKSIKHEQSIGARTKDNLNPETGLDFYIQKVELNFDDKDIKKRGWQ